jgi:hypothetical protein
MACAAGGLVGLYALFLRNRILTWGASEIEVRSPVPGDDLLEEADGVSTRAISIAAPPGAVWPWLAQMGPSPRGGAYTYDWIENLLGLNMHSTDRVLREFQNPSVGDAISFGSNVMRLEIVDPPRAIVWRSLDGNWVWSFQLEATPAGTRLLSRNRFRVPTLMGRIAMLPVEPGSLIMERKMLLGIRDRAERLAASDGGSG